MEFGDAYALRTFAVKDGRLASSSRRRATGWTASARRSAFSIATTPIMRCPRAGLLWRLLLLDRRELLDQYAQFARNIIAVIRLDELTIEGDKGVQANAAQIVAWWCAEEAPELAPGDAQLAPQVRVGTSTGM